MRYGACMNDDAADRALEPRSLDELAALLVSARTIAVVGFSDDPTKPSHTAPMELLRRGWDVVPVNPTRTEVAGLSSFARLDDVPRRIDLVDVFRRAEYTPGVVRDAVAVGAGAVWLQLDIANGEARAIALAGGLTYVEDACAGAIARRLDLFPR